ncbi:hypothetical protein B5K08_07615 [Rhizobium leguminosarum bv. trifolii]|uniref:Uncharacterized protein n=1 Tax=Rhizobium leguminosarum bv. trifolii TaxID=386 RepID=A0A3E1BT07_RHILT|nr:MULTISPECIES: hypothetical protein [Rhizobium]RFB96247.1 hypothetical protein B5K08_07615 [Rhizobium leguminosarum bv. trifolii]RFB97554.1 hypothetical protein B5K10_07605 [Rhizobium leguminosarum bv. trifolii]
MTTVAAEGGYVSGVGLADDDAVKAAADLGLIDVATGDAWTLVDTVSLTPRQRLEMGLPPIVPKPSMFASAANAIASMVGRVFGKPSPLR